MKIIITLFTLLFLLSTGIAEQAMYSITFGNGKVTIPYVAVAPKIDGEFRSGEWEEAMECNGFTGSERTLIPGRLGRVSISRDQKYLYFGIRTSTPTNDPGGALKTTVKQRDGAVYSDDSVEIILHADEKTNTGYQFVFNAEGTIFDRQYTESPKQSHVDWDCKDLQVASTTEGGWWTLEVAIPLSEIDDPKELVLFNVARNWSDLGYSTLNYTPNYFNRNNMLRGNFENKIAIVKEFDFGVPELGNWNIHLSAKNISDKKLAFTAQLWHNAKEGKVRDAFQSVTILPGETKEIQLKSTITSSLIHLCTLQLKDVESGRVYYARRVMGQKGRSDRRRPVTFSFDSPVAGTGIAYYYPGFNKIAVELDRKPENEIMLSILDAKPVPFKQAGKYWRAVAPVSQTPGIYSVQLLSQAKEYQIGKIEKKKYAWEGEKLGCEKIILPPFKPLQCNNNEVDGLLNKRTINGLGLYDSVRNCDYELLAAPMSFLMKVDGKETQWQADKKPVFKLHDNGFAAIASGNATTSAGINLSYQSTMEYDGFNWLQFQLDGLKDRTVDQLTLVIQFKATETPLFHAVANTLRPNPAGTLPDRWTGSQLNRKKHFDEEVIHPQLVPYLWLGGEERGLSWFLDSSLGFKLHREQDAVRISRRGDIVVAELDIINKPTRFNSDTLGFSFGFHPTPVKPLTPDLRNTLYDSAGVAPMAMNNAQFVFGTWLGGFFPFGLTPFKDDYKMWRTVMSALTSGKKINYREELDQWNKQYGKEFTGIMDSIAGNTEYSKRFQKSRQGFLHGNLGNKDRRPSLPYIYLDPRLAFKWYEEAQYFKCEWWNPAAQNYFGSWRIFPTDTYRDYFLYAVDRALKNGLHGIYLDDVYLIPDNNPDTLGAIDEQNEVHSCIGILALRDLIKRLSVLQHQHGKYPRILQVHMTDALLIPCFSFATSQLGFEAKYGESPLPTRYALDYIRAIGLGTKLGANGLMLQGVHRKTTSPEQWNEKSKTLRRSMLALSLPHGIRQFASHAPDLYEIYQKLSDFGCFTQSTRFIPYWDKAQDLRVDKEILLSSYQLPEATLVILSNYHNYDPVKVELSGNLPNKFKLVDLETNEQVSYQNITIQGYDFRLLVLTPLK